MQQLFASSNTLQFTARPTVFALGVLLALGNTSQAELLRANALQAGDVVMIVAPARGADRERTMLAKQRLEKLGLQVKLHKDLFRTNGYLAGTDEQRAGQIMDAFADKSVSAVLPITGGFGTTRMLDRLDYQVIRRNPKVLVGYSDITGLHLAIHKQTGLVTFHGPNLDSGLGIPKNLTSFSQHWFQRAILASRQTKPIAGYTIHWLVPGTTPEQFTATCELSKPITLNPGKARGELVGGNLTLVAALMGTPYEIETDGKILFLEDIGEAPYRVDRMLSTLRLGGKLDRLAGLVLGQFTYRSDQDTSIDEGQSVDDVLDSYFADLLIPVIKSFPFGHHRCNATLPIGIPCELDADTATLRLLECPVRLR